MSKSEMDLQAIREKLLGQRQQYSPTGAAPAPVGWSYSGLPTQPSTPVAPPGVPNAAATTPSPQLINAVETLRQRSAQGAMGQTVAAATVKPWNSEMLSEMPTQISLHQQRLQTLVKQINEFSARQEQAMVEMKTVAERLTLEQRRQQRHEEAADRLQWVPVVVYDEGAIVAEAEQDDQGNIVLAYRTADLLQADREASHLAQTLRDHNQIRRRLSAQSYQSRGLSTLLAEPLSAVMRLCHWSRDLAQQQWQRWQQGVATASPKRHRRRRSTFSWLDGVIWFGGGVIIRLALNLVLAAYPGLWSVAVAAVTGMTAYALYRATLAPHLEFGPAYRVLLAVGGLIVGGRLL